MACASSTKDGVAKSSDERDYVGKDALVDFETLRFEEDDERARFVAAQSCFESRAAGWEVFGLRKIGNFVQQDWCTGSRASLGCSGGAFRRSPNRQWAHVGTLHYPQGWPTVFGVAIGAGNVPENAWGVSASTSTNGKSILGDGTHVSFFWHGDETKSVHLGDRYGWEIAEESFGTVAGEPLEVLTRLRASPISLRDEGIARVQELRDAIHKELDAGVKRCVYGEYKGDGIPPECVRKEPLSPTEVEAERAKIDAELERVRGLLKAHHVEFHRLLIELLPDECLSATAG